MKNSFVVKGNFCQTKTSNELDLHENAFVVCRNGISKGIFETLPDEYVEFPLYDYGDALIFPGMVDLHIHAPQYAFRGMCMDLELMDWLNRYTFPEEEKSFREERVNLCQKNKESLQTTDGLSGLMEKTQARCI